MKKNGRKNILMYASGSLVLITAILVIICVSSTCSALTINVDQSGRLNTDNDDEKYLHEIVFEAVEAADPAASVYIEVYDTGNSVVANETTDENGELVLEDFENGDYTWKAFKDDEEIDSGSFDVKVGIREVQASVSFVGCRNTNLNDIGLETTDHYGTPIEDVSVHIFNALGNLICEGKTEYDGEFYCTELDEGWYEYKIMYDGNNINTGKVYSFGPDSEADSTIKGHITDEDTEEGIQSVEVLIDARRDQFTYSTWTDQNGYYEVLVRSSNDYSMVVSHRKYENDQRSISVSSDETSTQDFELDKRSMLYGNVTDQYTGDPIPSADIVGYGDNGDDDTYSRPNGYYELWVPAGDVTIEAFHDDYHNYKGTEHLDENEECEHDIEMTPDPKDARVYGYVTDQDDGSPIADVHVMLHDPEEDKMYDDYTDEDGYYSIPCYGNKRYNLHARHKDYYHYLQEDIYMMQNEEKQIDIELELKPLLYGYVTDRDTGKPIDDVSISLRAKTGPGSYSSKTDETGYYEIRIEQGEWKFIAHKDGYKDYYDEITIEDGEEKEYSPTMKQGSGSEQRLFGNVTDGETRDPIPDAYVKVTGDWGFTSTNTDENGYYNFNNLDAGEYEFLVQADGYHDYKEDIIVEIGENEKNVRLCPSDRSYIHGYISNEATGEKIQGAFVELEGDGSDTTDGNGYYFIVTDPGEYTILIIHEDFDDYTDGVVVSQAENKYDAELIPITFVEGFVTDRGTGDPIDGASIEFDDREHYETMSDSEGYYRIECDNGEYDITVTSDSYLEYSDDVNVDEGNNSYDVELRKSETFIHGYITNEENGKAVEGATLSFEDTEYSDMTDSEGYYYIECDSGTYTIVVSHEDYYNYELQNFEIESGENTHDVQLEPLVTTTSLEGYVSNSENGDTIGDALIELYGDVDYSVTSESDGYYFIECEPGEYDIVVTHDNHLQYEETNVDIGSGENTYDIQMEVIATTTYLEGYITDDDSSEPIDGAEIGLGGDDTYYGTTSDVNGYYYIECDSEDFTLAVTSDGYFDYSESISIKDGENEKDVTLTKNIGYIEGYVSDDSSVVVNGAMVELTGNAKHETFTDSNGHFIIECQIGEYDLRIKYDGFEDFSESDFIIEQGTNWFNISLIPIVELLGVELAGNTGFQLEQGEEITLSFLVTNTGETKEDFGFKIEGWDAEIGTISLKSTQFTIKPGETKMISAAVFLIESAPSGMYQFTLKSYLESDETTNDELEVTLEVTNDTGNGDSESGFSIYHIVGLVGILATVVAGLLIFLRGKNMNDDW